MVSILVVQTIGLVIAGLILWDMVKKLLKLEDEYNELQLKYEELLCDWIDVVHDDGGS